VDNSKIRRLSLEQRSKGFCRENLFDNRAIYHMVALCDLFTSDTELTDAVIGAFADNRKLIGIGMNLGKTWFIELEECAPHTRAIFEPHFGVA
jgi:hypothetical protein